MALPLTHSSVNGPSERLTGLDNCLHHEVYTLEKKIDAILHMDWLCNATELCMFISCVNYYCTCCRVAHISLNNWWINPVWQPISWTDKIQKYLYNAFAYDCNSIACPDHNKWFGIHTNASDFQLGRHLYYPRRKAGCLLLLQADNVIAKIFYIGKRNTFHHSYYQRILRYAPCFHPSMWQVPRNILATALPGSVAWLLWPRSWRGRNL